MIMLSVAGTSDTYSLALTDSPMVSAEYGLALQLRPGSTTVVAATLSPPEVAVDDIVAAAEGGAQAHGFIVREVRARLAQRLWRGAIIKGASLGVPAGVQGLLYHRIRSSVGRLRWRRGCLSAVL